MERDFFRLPEDGYNGFSFRDLALRAKITTASVHYHFPTKGDLGLALVNQQAGKMDGEKMGGRKDGRRQDGQIADRERMTNTP